MDVGDMPGHTNASGGSLFGSHGHNPNVPVILKTGFENC